MVEPNYMQPGSFLKSDNGLIAIAIRKTWKHLNLNFMIFVDQRLDHGAIFKLSNCSQLDWIFSLKQEKRRISRC